MFGRGIPVVPIVLGFVAIMAMLGAAGDRDDVGIWATVLGLTTLAAVAYSAFQEQRAGRAIALARRRLGSAPYDALRHEMDRARRHERPLALARIQLAAVDGARGVHALLAGPTTGTPTLLRSTDRSWRDGRSVYLLLPETSTAAATSMVRRAVAAQPAIEPGSWRVVAFPEDGLTIGALFEALDGPAPRSEELPVADAGAETVSQLAPSPQHIDQP